MAHRTFTSQLPAIPQGPDSQGVVGVLGSTWAWLPSAAGLCAQAAPGSCHCVQLHPCTGPGLGQALMLTTSSTSNWSDRHCDAAHEDATTAPASHMSTSASASCSSALLIHLGKQQEMLQVLRLLPNPGRRQVPNQAPTSHMAHVSSRRRAWEQLEFEHELSSSANEPLTSKTLPTTLLSGLRRVKVGLALPGR